MAKDRVLGSEFEKPIETVEQYKFEPIKGYPMLNWKGKRPFESTQFYPAQLKESYGQEVDGWLNRIYWGDNLQVMSHLLKEFRGKIDLIYVDPPFDSKAEYKKKIQVRGQSTTNDQTAFEEKQYTDIWTNDEYLQFMYERLILMRELLAANGSIYVHLDEKKVHHVRFLLDEIFGPSHFRREIIWDITVLSGFKTIAQNWIRGHDLILYYSKSDDVIFNKLKQPHRKEYLDRFDKDDGDGRKYFDGRGEKLYLEDVIAKGKAIGDVWADIMSFQQIPTSLENLKYPTQKPEALLDRIIRASTNPGALVFDCFMGSGTAQAVAMKLGRRFIGADVNLGAVQTTTKRLIKCAREIANGIQSQLGEESSNSKNSYTGLQVFNVNHYDFFRNELEAKELLIKALEVEPLPAGSLFDGQSDGRMVKVMPVNRIATRADLNELINGFDQKTLERRFKEAPNRAVEKVTLVCMGHEPSLAADLKKEMLPYKLDVEVVDILRDKSNLELKRDSEAEIRRTKNKLEIKKFYPMNLLQKLSISKQNIGDWKELVESVMIDFNYDGAVLEPAIVDVPEGNQLVKGEYEIPDSAGTVRVKITDLLSESLEVTLDGTN